jgi:hypothetical protein
MALVGLPVGYGAELEYRFERAGYLAVLAGPGFDGDAAGIGFLPRRPCPGDA